VYLDLTVRNVRERVKVIGDRENGKQAESRNPEGGLRWCGQIGYNEFELAGAEWACRHLVRVADYLG